VLFAGVFPASVMAPLPCSAQKPGQAPAGFLPVDDHPVLVVLILFTIVKTKIVHYSSLCYFPLTFVAAWWIYHTGEAERTAKKIIRIITIMMGVLIAVIVTGITFIDHYKEFIIKHNIIGDPFAVACLGASGGWKGYEALAAIMLIAGLAWFSLDWSRGKTDHGIHVLTAAVALFMFTAMLMIVPRIEAYSQRPAIEFFRSVSNQDAYLETIGYKSYAHLFYGKARNYTNLLARDEKWLLTGDIDKVAFFAVKINRRNG
jgi:hypothetical protein